MNTLLIFFALPVATVILTIVLLKILKNPLLVAATFFAIYLIVTFAFSDSSFLVFAILYTVLSYVTALIACGICRLIRILENQNGSNCRIIERPITINNTSPCNSVNLADDATLLPNTASANIEASGRMNENCNCNCGCRCRRR